MYDYYTLLAYDEYCLDCAYEGKSPVSFAKWLAGEDN